MDRQVNFKGVGSQIGELLHAAWQKSQQAKQQDDPLIRGAKEQFPILRKLDFGYKYNPAAQPGYLEFWPPQESGTMEWPRPSEFPMGTIGVEVYDPNTRPIDIMGDIASHYLVETDPVVRSYYQQFEQSLTEQQKRELQLQYQHAQMNFGEQRPFHDWYSASGLPGMFRGYAFQQWPDATALYTKNQRLMFDQMMQYLRSGD